jgi:uncharacterized protein
MRDRETIKTTLVVIAAFAGYYVLFSFFTPVMEGIDRLINVRILSYFITYCLTGIPLFAATVVINKSLKIAGPLGLGANILHGFSAALVFALPMFAGGLIFFAFNRDITFNRLIAGTLLAGFFEEFYFRGFLFGQLFRNSRFGFIPAVLLGAVLFASGHLYQSNELGAMAGVFLTTFMGAVLFAWLYVEWNYNLWVPVSLHFLMNLSWMIFSVSENALGGPLANLFRGLTITLAIVGTIWWKRRKGEVLVIGRSTLLWKN